MLKVTKINLPFLDSDITGFQSGDKLLLSGKLITARDAAHQKIKTALLNSDKLPFDLAAFTMYYCGPTPAKEGYPIGSCGPTTSSRMDVYVPLLLQHGLRYMIGKGNRSKEVIQHIKAHNGLYMIAIGGAGAFYAERVKSCNCIAYPELGPEAVYELEIIDFPVYIP
ncbi:MAG: fumarate hydratase C-terminal domain-containing protein [Candidatus Cloacimonetes bacterium]|nr:fumarate hydratase C-terminal domain-containing protein [Candidatus Cloacimonadota bacterium]